MSPEEPGAPDDAQREPRSTATFGSGAEPTERPPPTGDEPPGPAQPGPERRIPPIPRDVGPAGQEPSAPRPGDAGPPAAPTLAPGAPAAAVPPTDAPPKVTAPTARRRFLDDPDPDAPRAPRPQRVRHRKVRRIVRHIEPWSVLKISVLFFASIFLIICVASAVLWNVARSAGAIDDVESFVTSLGFGNCEDIEGDTATTPETTTTIDGSQPQLGGSSTTASTVAEVGDERSSIPDEDGECAEGQRLVGGFKFEDQRIFQSFALFGFVLVLSGAATSVVLALLFNLISDLTGGVRVTVLEEEPAAARRPGAAGPGRSDSGD